LHQILRNTSLYDLCITTYEMVKCSTMKRFLREIHWHVLVLDEGHRIKNTETDVSVCCTHLKARFKVILTGTPVQNDLLDTFGLLHFLHPDIFESGEVFERCFRLSSKTIDIKRDMLDKAHYMLRPFVLRRVKTEVERKLPPKLETVIKCPMSHMQKFWTRALLLKEADLIQNFSKNDGTNQPSSDRWKRLQHLFAQLRKAANHPYLFPNAESIDPENGDTSEPTEEIVTASGKMKVLDKMLPLLQRNGHRVVIFSQFTRTLDILSDYLVWRGYTFSRLDGSTNRVMRAILINRFNKKDSRDFIFLLSTRAGGEGVNLFTADTVVLYDSDWNPQVDIQAMARVHRIGQTKPVHVYRLVSGGSVEERIVQRAQKKLFLDSLVNRGSTANALRMDRQRLEDQSSGENNENGETDDPGMSTTMCALKFGWNASFSPSKELDLTERELLAIIDRTRGLEHDGGNGVAFGVYRLNEFSVQGCTTTPFPFSEVIFVLYTVGAAAVGGALLENQEMTVEEFDENIPFVNTHELDGELLRPNRKYVTLGDISKQWAVEGKRVSTSRYDTVKVKNVGEVHVLKLNNYSLNQGEPSVFEREAKGYKRAGELDQEGAAKVISSGCHSLPPH